ncbi:hydantoinase/oxoprolinase family protein [Bradyrhizobium sp. HKCCYLR20261]|uniref:hydantoinase/oxoprolinase family protein n=1 Tax=Bradyrhizobium sp. HKCCYLR20261 TaxID=3420760 RepID=UPI003EB80A11
MAFRIGVDIGGTFTDFVLVNDGSGVASTYKQLTTPHDPSEAVIAGVLQITAAAGINLSDVTAIVHGTTLVTNAIIERRGCRTGMLVTKGFKDSLDIGRESRYDLYDLRLEYPEPLVTRQRRIEVDERMLHDGTILSAIDVAAVMQDLAALVEAEAVEAIAVCLLHSYVNPAHEIALRDAIQSRFPNLYVSLSSEGYPVIREYERWTTTTLNAYVQPLVDRYLNRLELALSSAGFAGGLFIMSSSGGTLVPATARQFPSRLLESGPAAGILMSAYHGGVLGIDHLLAFDMGGTTAKGAFVVGTRPLKKYELEAARVHEFKRGSGLVINLPVIDMIEIGAGGGSISRVDERGLIRVGPRSAGAKPGPVAYGRGGEEPTLTDANFTLGYLNPQFFLGGRMRIDREAAAAAISKTVGEPLDLDTARAAWGIHEIINEDVAGAFRTHASERGIDSRSCAMIAFGGSGPLHAVRVARKLRIKRVVLPPAAGVMSAFGMLVSPLSFEAVRSHLVELDALTREIWDTQIQILRTEVSEVLLTAGVAETDITFSCVLDMRYQGQGYEIKVSLDLPASDALLDQLQAGFEKQYTRQFGLVLKDRPIEIASWRLEASAPSPAQGFFRVNSYVPGEAKPKAHRMAYEPDVGDFVPHAVYDRYSLPPGVRISGPALVEELESTTVIGSAASASVDDHFNLVVEI